MHRVHCGFSYIPRTECSYEKQWGRVGSFEGVERFGMACDAFNSIAEIREKAEDIQVVGPDT